MKYLICFICIIIWLYLLSVMKRAELNFWFFITGVFGMFIFLMVLVRPVMTQPLARVVAAMAGGIGSLTGTFTAYFKYGILFITSAMGDITLQIDFECSGIIEIIVYLSLLTFFKVYTRNERILLGVVGTLALMTFNALRVIIICEMIHFGGMDVYYIAHSVVGRLVFYVFSVLLYFYVFTKPQIVRIQVGKFKYGDNKPNN